MSIGLDTSLVLRLLTGEPPEQFALAQQRMAEAAAEGIQPLIDNLVVAEAYFALQHHYGLTKAEALKSIRALLDTGSFLVAASLPPVLRTANLARAKPGFIDRLIHSVYQKAGASLLTFESAAQRLPDAVVLKAASE